MRDVTIGDGSVLAPGAKFVKIWTLRNSGRVPWPAGCRLVFVGGDRLSSDESSVALPALAVDDEIDVAIDMTAPAVAGRYTSFWRLAMPAPQQQQRFGHRVWSSIHVEQQAQQPQPPLPLPLPQEEKKFVAPLPSAPKIEDHHQQQQQQQQKQPVAAASNNVNVAPSAPPIESGAVVVDDALKPNAMYASQLRQLSNMGFNDSLRNAALLTRHSGDVLSTVQDLLNGQ